MTQLRDVLRVSLRSGAGLSKICRLALALVTFTLFCSLTTATAFADYYAVGYSNVNNKGGYSNVCESKLWVYHPASDFVDQEMWEVISTASPGAWTEAGLTTGQENNGHYTSTPVFFWADQSAKYGYNQHFATYGPSAGSFYDTNIYYWYGNAWWYVDVGGWTGPGASYHESTTGVQLQTGLEFTNGGRGETAATGSNSSLQYWDTSGAKHSGWPNYQKGTIDGGADGGWSQPGTYWRDIVGGQTWSC